MSWTKREFIRQAFEEIGLASYDFDLSPEQWQSALRRLDSMMALWNAKGIRLSYPLPSSYNDSDLDEETQVPDSALDAIISGLAIRLSPSFGKIVSPETKALFKNAYDTLLIKAAQPIEMQMPGNLPMGAGNKLFDAPFSQSTKDALTAGANDALEIPAELDSIDGIEFIGGSSQDSVVSITIVQTALTWTDFTTRFDTDPVSVGTCTAPVSGDVYQYILSGITRYRLVPTPYVAINDVFYSSYDGSTCSGRIIGRGDS
ncbi:Tail accessory factor GP4 [uncultured Caudovirales phage]|uniref:Tail accessory factor GP4 n=1 Tax=uncultured Caudovirales phage TaxID=2100421 RepID=A0A6J5PBT9_9CAUD|nr:Tail accessory factor GP4 [uncultured Caudovirales phage]